MTSLSAFCDWARETELISVTPGEGISLLEQATPTPRWLDENEQYALVRAVQEEGKRDIALITLMLNTGLRVSELSNLKVSDVEVSPRRRCVTICGGKGEKFLSVPQNVDAGKAMQDCLEGRSEIGHGDYLF